MVGIFSRFSVGRAGHRRTQSALVSTQTLSLSVFLLFFFFSIRLRVKSIFDLCNM